MESILAGGAPSSYMKGAPPQDGIPYMEKTIIMCQNITEAEMPAMMQASLEVSQGDIDKAATTIRTIDTMLGVMKMKSLNNSRDRRAASRWSRGRGLRPILKNVILQNAQQ